MSYAEVPSPGDWDPKPIATDAEKEEIKTIALGLCEAIPYEFTHSLEVPVPGGYKVDLSQGYLLDLGRPEEPALTEDEAVEFKESQGVFDAMAEEQGIPKDEVINAYRQRYMALDMVITTPSSKLNFSINMRGQSEFRARPLDEDEEASAGEELNVVGSRAEAKMRVQAAAIVLKLIEKGRVGPENAQLMTWLVDEMINPVKAGLIYKKFMESEGDILLDYIHLAQRILLDNAEPAYVQEAEFGNGDTTIVIKRSSPAKKGPNPGSQLEVSYEMPLDNDSVFDYVLGHLSCGGVNDFWYEVELYNNDAVEAQIETIRASGSQPALYLVGEANARAEANKAALATAGRKIRTGQHRLSSEGVKKTKDVIDSTIV